MTRKDQIRAAAKLPFVEFAKKYLKVVDEKGNLVPFVLNEAQLFLHARLEAQLSEHGYVRAVVPKARKMGMSTYIAARFFHRVLFSPNKRCLVLSASDPDSRVLLDKYKLFHANLPQWLKPQSIKDSAMDFVLEHGSSLRSVTAGSKSSARGDTAQLLHASEISSWPDQANTIAGALNTVALVEGTELIIESTAKTRADEYFRIWTAAVSGESVFTPCFLPWFLDTRYQLTPPVGFVKNDDELALAKSFKLNDAQLYWRRVMIADKGEWLFKQEFPATPNDCFAVNATDVLIPPEAVDRAQNCPEALDDNNLPLVMGVDVARFGSDKTIFINRRGRVVEKIEAFVGKSNVDIAALIKERVEDFHPDRVNIDSTGGHGAGVVDILRADGYDMVHGVNSSESSPDSQCLNTRSYCYKNAKEWLLDYPCSIPKTPEGDALVNELSAIPYKFDSKLRLQIVKKEDIKKKLGHSPDFADAFALTFATKLSTINANTSYRKKLQSLKKKSPLYSW